MTLAEALDAPRIRSSCRLGAAGFARIGPHVVFAIEGRFPPPVVAVGSVKHSYRITAITLAATSVLAWAQPSAAQSLRGSHASVNLMYRRAVRGGLDFYETPTEVRRAVIRGELVALRGNANYTVANIRMPYVRPETRAFVIDLAGDYRRTCGDQMVVTSATRPMSRRLANGSSISVHPTGMAIDLRKPTGRCLTWLRRTLIAYERRGVIEATEERRPPHFHIAVLPSQYEKAVASRARTASGRGARAED